MAWVWFMEAAKCKMCKSLVIWGRNGSSLITYSYNYQRIPSKVVYNMYVLYVSRGMVFWWGCSYGLGSDAMMVGGSEGQGMDYDIDVGFERW